MPSINVDIKPQGALVLVFVGLSQPRVQAMQAAGVTAPKPVCGTFLLDTGATSTCVDPTLIAPLGLAPTGSVSIQTPSTVGATHQCNQYDASIYIPGDRQGVGFVIPALPILETHLSSQGIDGLIGRDIIDRCTLVYVGSARIMTLAY